MKRVNMLNKHDLIKQISELSLSNLQQNVC